MNKYFVYKHTTPSGKVYIGITCQKLSQRWANGKGYKNQRIFANSIQKYGWDNIKHDIVCEELTKEQAEQMEIELIAKYKSQGISLNASIGGGLVRGWHQTEETKQIISKLYSGSGNPQYGKPHSVEHNRKISESLKGRPRPQEVRNKISASHKGKPKSESHKTAISKSIKGRKFIHKDGQLKQVCPETISEYLAKGWELGFIKR